MIIRPYIIDNNDSMQMVRHYYKFIQCCMGKMIWNF